MLQRELRLCLETFEYRICSINILQLQRGFCPLDQNLWVQLGHDPGLYALAQSPAHAMTLSVD